MGRWDEIRAHLVERFSAEIDEQGRAVISWRLHRDDRAGPQRLRVGQVELFDVPCVLLVAKLFPEPVFDPHDALALNAALPVAKVALHGDLYVMQEVFPTEHLELGALDRCIEQMVREAMRLRLAVIPEGHSDAFSHYDD